MLSLFLLVPLAALLVLNLPLGALRRLLPVGGMLLALAQVVLVIWRPAQFWKAEDFLGTSLHLLPADNLGCVMLLCIGIVLFITFLIGRQTIPNERQRVSFYNLLLVSMVGMNGSILLQDIFTLYVFIEVTSVASFVMIALNRGLDSLEGAFTYLVLSAVATVLMLCSIALMLTFAHGTSYEAIREAVAGAHGNILAKIAVGGFLCGLLIKSGMVPFHGWLPGAYSKAPAAVSVFLAGIATKVSGVYALIRLLISVFPNEQSLGEVTMLVATISIVVGALAALKQTDFKRMLAYSSISQVGYIILGLGCFMAAGKDSLPGQLALAGALFHLFNHAIFKSLLFVNSASVEQQLGTTDMTRMQGLGSRMPLTGFTSIIASLSTAGVPPLSGFWSKLFIIVALVQAGRYSYAVIAIAASVLTLAYFLGMQRRVFFGKPREQDAAVHESGVCLSTAAVLLSAIIIVVGLAFPYVMETLMVAK